MGAEAIGAIATAISGIFSSIMSSRDRKKQNERMLQMAILQQMNQERLSNTAHQRETRDLQEAGFSPVAALGGAGASTPVGAMAGTSTVDSSGVIPNAIEGLSKASQFMQTKENIKEQEQNIKKSENDIKNNTKVANAETAKATADIAKANAEEEEANARREAIEDQNLRDWDMHPEQKELVKSQSSHNNASAQLQNQQYNINIPQENVATSKYGKILGYVSETGKAAGQVLSPLANLKNASKPPASVTNNNFKSYHNRY